MLRRIPLGGLLNLRDLGGYPTSDGRETAWGRLYRSDTPRELSPADIQWFLDHKVTTVIDLRSEAEAGFMPNALANVPGISYHHCPLLGGEITEKTEAEVGPGYFRTLDRRESVAKILRLILAAPDNVLFHCMAGKDRTGQIAMLLLSLAGVDRLDILADYQTSCTYLEAMILRLKVVRPEMPDYAAKSEPWYMQACMDRLLEKYGTVYDYLRATGLTDDELAALRDKLLA